jgi:hypothetical protein
MSDMTGIAVKLLSFSDFRGEIYGLLISPLCAQYGNQGLPHCGVLIAFHIRSADIWYSLGVTFISLQHFLGHRLAFGQLFSSFTFVVSHE